MDDVRDLANSHSESDVATLHQMWASGATLLEIAAEFGVSVSTIHKWRHRYKLPRREPRVNNHMGEPDPPSEVDDELSRDSLALSPWVEARARECREAHYEQRRAESLETTRTKAWRWDLGICMPSGGRH